MNYRYLWECFFSVVIGQLCECVSVLSVSSRFQVWSIGNAYFQLVKHLTQNFLTLNERRLIILLAHILIFLKNLPLNHDKHWESAKLFTLSLVIKTEYCTWIESPLLESVHIFTIINTSAALFFLSFEGPYFKTLLINYF